MDTEWEVGDTALLKNHKGNFHLVRIEELLDNGFAGVSFANVTVHTVVEVDLKWLVPDPVYDIKKAAAWRRGGGLFRGA